MQDKTNVLWYEGAIDGEISPPISSHEEADIVVVGGGMAGLMCAEELASRGRSVVLLERGFCGAGASGKTSGFITPDSELELSSLLETYGPERARELWEFVSDGVEMIRDRIARYRIACDYQPQDSLFVAARASDSDDVATEYAARQTLNYASTVYDRLTIKTVLGARGYDGGVRYPDTFGMNSYAYCQAMKRALIRAGVRVYEDSPVSAVDESGVVARGFRVRAGAVILCTDRFTPELGMLKNEVYHVQTFLAASDPISEEDVKRIFPEERMMVWDSDLVYQYFRVTGENRLLIGGADILYTYRVNEQKNLARMRRKIRAYVREKFPFISTDIAYLWPGMLGVTKDLLPIAGIDPAVKNVYFIAAASGLPWAAALGRRIAELVCGGAAGIEEMFRPDRAFILHPRIEHLLGTKITYALSHGKAKYRDDYPELARKVAREIKKAID